MLGGDRTQMSRFMITNEEMAITFTGLARLKSMLPKYSMVEIEPFQVRQAFDGGQPDQKHMN